MHSYKVNREIKIAYSNLNFPLYYIMTEPCSHMTIEYTYGTDFPEFHIYKFFLKLIGLLSNFKTASLLTPSLIPENFNSIGLVVFEISYVKISKF